MRNVFTFFVLSLFFLSSSLICSPPSEIERESVFRCFTNESDGKVEFAVDYKKIIRATPCQEEGITGKGIVVGIIENALDPLHSCYKASLTQSTIEETTEAFQECLEDYYEDLGYPWFFRNYFLVPISKFYMKNEIERSISHAAFVASIVKNVAPDARLRVIALHNNKVICTEPGDSLVNALNLMAQDEDCRIVNLSIGDREQQMSEELEQAMIKVAESGKIIVMAAGNKGIFFGEDAYTNSLDVLAANPQMKRRLIFAGGTTYPLKLEGDREALASYSNRPGFGFAQDYFISAPGDFIYGASSNNGWKVNSGTSFAAPQIAGSLALLMGVAPGLKPEQYTHLLKESARKVKFGGHSSLYRDTYGCGVVNVEAAVQLAREKGWVNRWVNPSIQNSEKLGEDKTNSGRAVKPKVRKFKPLMKVFRTIEAMAMILLPVWYLFSLIF